MNKIYKDKYLYVYADIFFTKGHTRTLMCDLNDKTWHFISNDFYETILLFRQNTIDAVLKSNPYKIDVEELIRYLLNHQYANIVDDISRFPPMDLKWYSAHLIENALIDIDIQSNHDYSKIALELEQLLCKNIQIRSYIQLNLNQIEDIIKIFIGKDFSSIEFIVKYNNQILAKDYLLLAKKYPSISFMIHSSPYNKFHRSLLHKVYPIVGYVQYVKQIISSPDCCGIINTNNLVHPSNVHDYMEGILRNKCLNKKISIAANGDIKNCPSMKRNYGNIRDTSLIDVCAMKTFRSYWYITKDQIRVCKDCEYRYVCNDCRAFVKNKFDKPMKCLYNPYGNK